VQLHMVEKQCRPFEVIGIMMVFQKEAVMVI